MHAAGEGCLRSGCASMCEADSDVTAARLRCRQGSHERRSPGAAAGPGPCWRPRGLTPRICAGEKSRLRPSENASILMHSTRVLVHALGALSHSLRGIHVLWYLEALFNHPSRHPPLDAGLRRPIRVDESAPGLDAKQGRWSQLSQRFYRK